MFTDYQQVKITMLQIMNEDSVIIKPDLMPKISDAKLLEAYRLMCLSRTQEEIQTEISEKGKNLNFLASAGQEATEVGYAIHLRKGKDWLVPAYRNNAAWLTAGMPISNIYLYWLGNEMGSKIPEDLNLLPVNIPIGTQYSHAAGIAFAEKYKKQDGIVITTIGDGGSSEGEVFEAMNFAAIHKLPIIFFIENNQWSLTTPRSKASATDTLAIRGVGAGLSSMQVDGNDFFAVYAAVEEAIKGIKNQQGPYLIEAITYRRFAHSASDIKKDYYDEKLENTWLKKDPIARLKKYLITEKKWDEQQQEKLDKEQAIFVRQEIDKAIAMKATPLADIFKYTYHTMTNQLNEQLAEAEQYFAKKGE